jgi:hypothetical protein
MVTEEQTGDLTARERAVSAILGTALSLWALRRGNVALRSIAGITGTALLARGIAGHCGIKAALAGEVSLWDGLREQWRRLTLQLPTIYPVNTQMQDAVDTSSRDSFPASDAPASRFPDEPPANAEAKWQAWRAAQNRKPF